MRVDSRINYHLAELEIARDPTSSKHVMPHFAKDDEVILDIGCGIGQTFVASAALRDKVLVGLDIDLGSLAYGNSHFDGIHWTNGSAACLPFKSNSFDHVISRVTLPLVNIPKSLIEIRRVLRNNGRVWLVLHPLSMVLTRLAKAIFAVHMKRVIFDSYVIVNGIVFHFTGKQFAFPINRRYESFQTSRGITRALRHAGFEHINMERKGHFAVTAEKKHDGPVSDSAR